MIKQRSTQWFAQRKGRITASNVGAILGLAPYATRDDVMRRMCMEWQGLSSDFQGNAATEYGTFHEQLALLDLKSFSNVSVNPVGFITHSRHDWLGASPDGLVGEDGIVEIKCPYGLRDDINPKFKNIMEQPHYYAQIQIQLYCTGRNVCYFCQWTRHSYEVVKVFYEPNWIKENLPKLKEFYDAYLELRDKPILPARIEMKEEHSLKLLDEFRHLSESIDFAMGRKKEIMDELVDLSAGENATIGDAKLTKVHREGSISYAKVVKDYCKDIDLERYRGPATEFWTLR
jgi:putative phage-type endonuclease